MKLYKDNYSIQNFTDLEYTQHYFGEKEVFGTATCEGEIGDFAEAVWRICESITENELDELEEMKDILGECYEILVVNNWRGDLVDRILKLKPFNDEEDIEGSIE